MYEQCTSACFDPTTALNFQANARWQLQYVSQAPGTARSMEDEQGPYVFDDSAGQGTQVFIVDTGANLNNPVSFSTM